MQFVEGRFVFAGPRNRTLGWILLLAGFVGAGLLDPWSASEKDPIHLPGSARMAARQAQAVLLGMALLQLSLANILEGYPWVAPVRVRASFLALAGTFFYALGYTLALLWPPGVWLVPYGALLNAVAFGLLLFNCPPSVPSGAKVLLSTFLFGMVLDTALGLFAADPGKYFPHYLGTEDSVRLRMLRLARAASVALPTLAVLYGEFLRRDIQPEKVLKWAGIALIFGAAAMPVTLTAAALSFIEIKYLLGLPAQAALAGALAGAWFAWKNASLQEWAGWTLVAGSMTAGLFMGLYAFDGPFPDPSFLGGYLDFPRRLARLTHAYAVVLGISAIFLARAGARNGWLLLAGTTVTLLVPLVLIPLKLPVQALSFGPTFLTAALLTHFIPLRGLGKRDGSRSQGA
jgi:hypothetical protein